MGIIFHGNNYPWESSSCGLCSLLLILPSSKFPPSRSSSPICIPQTSGMLWEVWDRFEPPASPAPLPIQPLIPLFPPALPPHADPNPTFSSLKSLSPSREKKQKKPKKPKKKPLKEWANQSFSFIPAVLSLERAPELSLFHINSSRIDPSSFPSFPAAFKAAPAEAA